MSLTTLTYILFLTACVFLHYMLPKKYRNMFLLAASVFFLCYAMPKQTFIMMIYVFITFVLGLKTKKGHKSTMFSSILISICFLFAYKYLNFACSLFTGNNETFSLVAPIGISYVTFQCIAYIVEIYKGNIKPIKNPISFFNYTLLFTKITAGPIEPPASFFKNYLDKRPLKWANIQKGIVLISTGFAKKVAIADLLAPGVAAIFDNNVTDGLSVILALVMYSFQIYFDFSGYTDIARGSAVLFGLNLTENFEHPYLATSVVEFWKKWHISLTNWLKNYIYFPLGGSRTTTIKRYRNVFIVFLVSGLWHGASLNFVFWGALHGIFQISEMLLKNTAMKFRKALHIGEDSVIHNVVSCFRTFVMVTFAWIFFRADTMNAAFNVIKNMFSSWNDLSSSLDLLSLDKITLIIILLAYTLSALFRYLCKKRKTSNLLVIVTAVIMIWLVLAAEIILAKSGATSSFIYFNF